MGGSLVRNPPLRRMVEKTVAELGIKVFVETGTNNGLTAKWAAGVFKRVITIEADTEKAMAASDLFAGFPNVSFYYGDSGELLESVVKGMPRGEKAYPGIYEPALFWLDAHNTTDRPPIREELDVILSHGQDHIIYIDDAQYFWMQGFHDWPTMTELRICLAKHAVALVSDAMVAYPPKWGKFLKEIARNERRSTYIPGEGIG